MTKLGRAIVAEREKLLRVWIKAVVSSPEAWKIKALVEFLDDSASFSSTCTWIWDSHPVPSLLPTINDLSWLRQRRLNFIVGQSQGSLHLQSVLPDYAKDALGGEESSEATFTLPLKRKGMYTGVLREIQAGAVTPCLRRRVIIEKG